MERVFNMSNSDENKQEKIYFCFVNRIRYSFKSQDERDTFANEWRKKNQSVVTYAVIRI